jgi:hypothetical protein
MPLLKIDSNCSRSSVVGAILYYTICLADKNNNITQSSLT